jgi:glycosyltransferase involved in cell wall biosynthesis
VVIECAECRDSHLYKENLLRASIVVPVRNRPDLLERTLQTLVAQDMPASEYEIVICDDGSTENIQAVVKRSTTAPVRIRFVRQPPLGPAAARNLGVRASQSAIILFIDSDVLVDSTAVRQLIDALDSKPEWKGAEACLHPIGEEVGALWDAPVSMDGGRYHTAAIAYRRDALLAVGGFDEQFMLPACEDVEIALRVLELGPIGFVQEAVVSHPKRRVTWRTHWRWRKHWRYNTIIALRYGVLAFPGKSCGPFPRLRVAWSALVTLPGGRLLVAFRGMGVAPRDALTAALLALFDLACGAIALATILTVPLCQRRNYLQTLDNRTAEGAGI